MHVHVCYTGTWLTTTATLMTTEMHSLDWKQLTGRSRQRDSKSVFITSECRGGSSQIETDL